MVIYPVFAVFIKGVGVMVAGPNACVAMDAQIRVPLDPALYPVQLLPGALCNAAHRYIFARASESARAVPLYMTPTFLLTFRM